MPGNQIHIAAGRPASSQPLVAEALRNDIKLEGPTSALYIQLARDFCDGHPIQIGTELIRFDDLALQGVDDNGDGRVLSDDEKQIKGRQIFDRLTDRLVDSITPVCKGLSTIEIRELCAKTAVQLASSGASQADGHALIHAGNKAEESGAPHIAAGDPSKMAIRVVPDGDGRGFVVHKRAVFHTLTRKTPVAVPLQSAQEYDTEPIAYADKPALVTDFRFRIACNRADNFIGRATGKEKFLVTGAPISFELETPCREFRDALMATRQSVWDQICNWFAELFGANCLLCRTECETYDHLETRPLPTAFSRDKDMAAYLHCEKSQDELLPQDSRVKLSYTEPDTLRGKHLFTVFRAPVSFLRNLQQECTRDAGKFVTTEALIGEFRKEMVDRGATPEVQKINGQPLLPRDAVHENPQLRLTRILNEVEEISDNDPLLKNSVLRMLTQFPRNLNESALTVRMHETFGPAFSLVQMPPARESVDVIVEDGRAVRATCTSTLCWDKEDAFYALDGVSMKRVPQGAVAHVHVTYDFVDGGLRVAQAKVQVDGLVDAIARKEKSDAEARAAIGQHAGKRAVDHGGEPVPGSEAATR